MEDKGQQKRDRYTIPFCLLQIVYCLLILLSQVQRVSIRLSITRVNTGNTHGSNTTC